MNDSWAAAGSVGERGPHAPIRARRSARPVLALIATGLLALGLGLSSAAPNRSSDEHPAVTGPVAWLLSASTDLGPARRRQISVAAALRNSARPQTLFEWATDRHLTVRWERGADWAYIEGTPADVAAALKTAVHDYRSRSGQVFYAAGREPSIPAPIRAEVSELGRILGYQSLSQNRVSSGLVWPMRLG